LKSKRLIQIAVKGNQKQYFGEKLLFRQIISAIHQSAGSLYYQNTYISQKTNFQL